MAAAGVADMNTTPKTPDKIERLKRGGMHQISLAERHRPTGRGLIAKRMF
jgi:hypothetical protein